MTPVVSPPSASSPRAAGARRLRGPRLLELGLAGWTAAVFVFLYLPIIVLVAYSFNTSKLNIVWEGFTFRWYGDLFHHTPLIRALKNSLGIAAAATSTW